MRHHRDANMVAFEPSTWAEVEEAEAMGKESLRPTNPLVTDIVRFTSAPERCISSPPDDPNVSGSLPSRPLSPVPDPVGDADKQDPDAPAPAETPHPNARYNIPPQRLIRANRNNMHFEDLLRLGRVNLATNTLARWKHAKSNTTIFERSLAADAASNIAVLPSPVNPSSTLFDHDAYLVKVHAETSRSDLAQGLKNLSNLISLIDNQADDLRIRAYPSVCLAAAELENTRQIVAEREKMLKEGRTEHLVDSDNVKLFSAAETTLKERYSVVLQREQEIDQLQRVLAVVSRFEWVFTLGSRMRDAPNLPIETIERLACEYARGREWVESQDLPTVARIARDMDDGLGAMSADMTQRLSNPKASRVQMKRIVSILASLDCEPSILAALEDRLAQAREKLDVAARTNPASFPDEDAPASRTAFVESTTSAFISGLSIYWRLAVVANPHEQCSAHVYRALPSLTGRYVGLVRRMCAGPGDALSRGAVCEVMRAHACCVGQLKVPGDCAGALHGLVARVSAGFISDTARAVRASARQVALDVLRDRSPPVAAAALVQAVACEALAQAQDVLARPTWARTTTSRGDATRPPPDAARASAAGEFQEATAPAVRALRDACMGALATTARVLEESLAREDGGEGDAGARALRVAVFCVRVKESSLAAVRDRTREVLGEAGLAAKYDAGLVAVERVRATSIREFVRSVAPSLEKIGARIAAYPSRSGSDKSPRTYNFHIKSVSPQAPELVLELALSAADTRRRGADARVVYEVTKELISRVGHAIATKVKAADLRAEHAAQVWVDCSYISTVVSAALPDDGEERYAILSGLTEAIKTARSVLAKEGKGSDSFRPETLTEGAVSPAVDDAEILRRCLVGDTPSSGR